MPTNAECMHSMRLFLLHDSATLYLTETYAIEKEGEIMFTFTLPDQKLLRLEKGKPFIEAIRQRQDFMKIFAVVINGKLHDINYVPKSDAIISFVYEDSEVGKMIYERTLAFVFIAAVHSLYERVQVRMEHALSSGQYCEIDRMPFLTPYDVTTIRTRMNEIIANNERIERRVVDTSQAVEHFESIGMQNKADLLKCRKSKKSSIYSLCGIDDYFYGIMLPHAGYITHFDLRFYAPGVWLSAQTTLQEQRKLFHVFQAFEKWGHSIGVSNVAQLNRKIQEGKMDELVLMSETMLEKQLAEMASHIMKTKPHTKFILIAGPSSAGKTTFSKRLAIHLKILGMEPFPISMDNFYKSHENTPRLSDGSFDFESIEAVDIDLFNDTMLKLLHQTPVTLPVFNFHKGTQEFEDHETQLGEKDILIIEGIHGLDPQTSQYLPDDAIFKIYINALTHLNLDEHNRIPTSDYRLIRRIVRDYQSRSWNAAETISFWKNVRDGEDKYIYPYQESADYIFNTSMVYELAVLKRLAIPLLNEIPRGSKQYLEANRLKKLLAYFEDGASDAIPRYSILSEFVGNSILDVS